MHTIFIVDDEEDFLGLISPRLEKWGYKVMPFTEGGKVLEYLTLNPCPDLMLLDLGLQDMSGFKVLVEAKAKCPQLCIWIISAFIGPDIKAQAQELKADDFLGKPFTLVELKEKLQRHFEMNP